MNTTELEPVAPTPENVEHLSPVAARMILAAFPEHIRAAFERRAEDIDYPIEAVLEMAFA